MRLVAGVVGQDYHQVFDRIRRHPELNAVYGNRGPTGDAPVPPTELEVQLRGINGEPDIAAQQRADAEMVKRTERLIHEGLEKVGVPKATLDKIRTLRGIEVTGGQIIAQSVSDIYQLYYIELMSIPARREEIKRRYLDEPAPESGENKAPLSPMEKMFWQRADTELFEQMGKGLDRFISGTQVLLAMQRGKIKPLDKKRPGF